MVDIMNDPDCPRAGRHREIENAVVNAGEESVQRVIGAVRNFTNPFTVADKNRLEKACIFWCARPHGNRDGRDPS